MQFEAHFYSTRKDRDSAKTAQLFGIGTNEGTSLPGVQGVQGAGRGAEPKRMGGMGRELNEMM
jgi:hypothetical protein